MTSSTTQSIADIIFTTQIFDLLDMSSSSKDLFSAVPVLNGTNYRIWKIQMSNYLHAKGLWQYVRGLVPRPKDAPPTGTAAAPIASTAEAAEKQLAWDIKDDEANGLIMLKVAYSLHGQQGITSYHSWESLNTMFNIQGAAALFNDFQKVVNYRISGSKHPGAEIDALAEMLDRLHANSIELSDFIKAMLLLNALPPSLSQVTTIALQTQFTTDLQFSGLRSDIITKYKRKTLPSTNKLSAVKRKGQDPSYRSQKRFQPLDQPDCAPAEGSSNKGKGRST